MSTASAYRRALEAVAAVSGISERDLLSRRRQPPIARARQVVHYLTWKHGGGSTTAVAKRVERCHTTIAHSIATVRAAHPNSWCARVLRSAERYLVRREKWVNAFDPNQPFETRSFLNFPLPESGKILPLNQSDERANG